MSKLEISSIENRRWALRYEGDPTPISEHDTLAEAETAGRTHARELGAPIITVHELDGEHRTMIIDPDYERPANVSEVKGPSVS